MNRQIVSLGDFTFTSSYTILTYRAYKSKSTAGISFYWTLFSFLSGFFTLIEKPLMLFVRLGGLSRMICVGSVIYMQIKFPLASNRFRELKFMYYCAILGFILLISTMFRFLRFIDLSFWCDVFAIASQSKIFQTSRNITNFDWYFILLYMISIGFRLFYAFAYSLISFEINMWVDFFACSFIFLYAFDFLYFYIVCLMKPKEDIPEQPN